MYNLDELNLGNDAALIWMTNDVRFIIRYRNINGEITQAEWHNDGTMKYKFCYP